ncbi:MAG: hypothetical protein R3Y18_03905 [Bacillota bacterium]
MENLIGQELAKAVSHYKRENLTELRLRIGSPLQVEYCGEMMEAVSPLGKKIMIEKSDIKTLVQNFTNGSFFSKEVEIKEGFLTKNGARLGVCGNCGYLSGEISSIADITSLALRLPFQGEIIPCVHASNIAKNTLSTLVISPYGVGKTTFLKKILTAFPKNKKVFLCDERGEFLGATENLTNVDTMRFAKKNKAFEIAIRLFSPHVIMIDEMFYSLDAGLLEKARMAGIAIYASFHGRNIQDYKNSEVFKGEIFQRYVILSEKNGKGTVDAVLDENFREINIYKENI